MIQEKKNTFADKRKELSIQRMNYLLGFVNLNCYYNKGKEKKRREKLQLETIQKKKKNSTNVT